MINLNFKNQNRVAVALTGAEKFCEYVVLESHIAELTYDFTPKSTKPVNLKLSLVHTRVVSFLCQSK